LILKAFDHLRSFLSRCTSFLRQRSLNEELEEEVLAHIELATEENIALGMNPQQARTVALRRFGGPTQIKEIYRKQRGFPLLDQVGRDLRFGLRQLFRAPSFAATAILTLALGLGANTTIFSMLNALLLRPLPVPHSEELAVLSSTTSDSDPVAVAFSAPMFRAIEKRHDVFSSVAAFGGTQTMVRGSSGNQQLTGTYVSGAFFSTMQIEPLMGRLLTPVDDRKGSPSGYVVVISEGFWRSWFHAEPSAIGSKLTIGNIPFTVVGVTPKGFFGADPMRRPEIYLPLETESVVDAPFDMIAGGANILWLQTIARRLPNITLDQANAGLKAASIPVLEEAVHNPEQLKRRQDAHFQLRAESGSTGTTYLRSRFKQPLLVVFALCVGVLVLTCLNLASLLMARAAARERELATRLAIGASRGRLIQQLLIESLLIAALGAIAGIALAPVVSRALAALLLGGKHDLYLDTSLDWRASAFAVALTLVTGLLIGLLPALRATSGDLNQQIKNGAYASSGSPSRQGRRRRLPQLLMSVEVALALMLVVGAGLLTSSLVRLYRTGLGFDPKGVVALGFDMDKQPLEGDALLLWYRQFGETLAHQPGVKQVSFAGDLPLSGGVSRSQYHSSLSNGDQDLHMNETGPNYFETMRIPILRGRDFQWTDSRTSGGKIILNQAAAKRLFPGRDALGQTVFGYKDAPFEVIAVVGDTKYESIRKDAPPGAYSPITQGDWPKPSYSVLVRVEGSPLPLAATARSLVSRTAPDIPAPVFTSMASQLDDSISSERLMALLSGFFALCALLVTGIGLYGTLAYATARRTNEIGIRMALGARRLQVVALVFRENTGVAVVGALAGLAAALVGSKVLSSFLYGTSGRDPWVLAGSVAALALIASAASFLPALRASQIEPMEALRAE
jgi:predicted permease